MSRPSTPSYDFDGTLIAVFHVGSKAPSIHHLTYNPWNWRFDAFFGGAIWLKDAPPADHTTTCAMAGASRAWPAGSLRANGPGEMDLDADEALPANPLPANPPQAEAPAPQGEDEQPPRPRAARGKGTRKQPTCAGPGCIYSTAVPGQPCRVEKSGAKCMWCAATSLPQALETAQGQRTFRRALNEFERLDSPALQPALAKLPASFQRAAYRCLGPNCVFSHTEPGQPAHAPGGGTRCILCDRGPDGRLLAETTEAGRKALERLISEFTNNYGKYRIVWDQAWARLSEECKEGCSDIIEWSCPQSDKHEAARWQAKDTLHSQRRMLAADPLLQRERLGMWAEDFHRVRREQNDEWEKSKQTPAPDRPAGHALHARGARWVLRKPDWTCTHQAWFSRCPINRKDCPLKSGYMCDSHTWTCLMNSAKPPALPMCRICTEGFQASDTQPLYEELCRTVKHLPTDAARLAAYLANFDLWVAKQPDRARAELCRWRQVPWKQLPPEVQESRRAETPAARVKRQREEAEAYSDIGRGTGPGHKGAGRGVRQRTAK